jgi:hypothetical protein
MIVFVDTPIWSLSLRRTRRTLSAQLLCDELAELIREAKVGLIGPVRQEILSGIADDRKFDVIRSQLRGFEDVPLATTDFEQAARLSNRCRRRGIQGSQVDFALCAVAGRFGGSIFTTDRDFTLYAKHIDIPLHAPRKG